MSNAPLKILFLCNRVPWPLTDGGNIASYHLMNELLERGHTVHCLSLNTTKHFVAKNELPFKEMVTIDIDTSISIVGASKAFFQRLPYNILRFESTKYRDKLQSILRETDYNLVQLEGAYMGIYSDTIREYSKAKLILRAHNIESRIWARIAKNKYTGIQAVYAKRMVKKIMRFESDLAPKVDAVLSLTEVDASWFKSKTEKPILAIPAGIKSSPYKAPLKTNNSSFCFIGSLEWEPNVQGLKWFVREIWPAVYKENTNLRFHIAGKNPSEKLMSYLDVPGVIVHGFVESAQEFCQSHTVFLVPLRSGSGMRLKIIEAMNWSKAIVSTTIGCEGIPVTNAKELLIADSPESWIRILLDISTDHSKQEELAANAHRFVQEHYDWNILSAQHENFYRKLL